MSTTTSTAAAEASLQAGVQDAHEAYVAAINANDTEQFLLTVSDDIVFLPPGSAPIAGKQEVGVWVKAYFDAFRTHWTKTTVELVAVGDVAYEWYRYRSVDTPRDGGAPATDSGNGVNIYRRGADGTWRVARDIWASEAATAAA